MRTFGIILRGAVIIALFTVLDSALGRPLNLLGIVAASIICTAGIGLIFWIPIAFILGSFMIGIEKAIKARRGGSMANVVENVKRAMGGAGKGAAGEVSAETKDNLMLPVVNYICAARDSGMLDSVVEKNLKQAGWPNDVIEKSFFVASSHPAA